MITHKKIFFIFFIVFAITGCNKTTKVKNSLQNKDIYKDVSKKYNIDYKILKGISVVESNNNIYAININSNKYKKKSYLFKNKEKAILFAKKLYNEKINFDAGINQININWKKSKKFSIEDLFNKEKNLDLSRSILSYNLERYCNGDINCRLSVYNTGYKKSKIGKRYTNKVILSSKNFN